MNAIIGLSALVGIYSLKSDHAFGNPNKLHDVVINLASNGLGWIGYNGRLFVDITKELLHKL